MERTLKSGISRAGVAYTQFNAHFHGADANKDKLLNFEEYLVFVEKENASKKIRREPIIEKTNEDHQAMFDALNKITADVDGVSKQDLDQYRRYAQAYTLGDFRKPLMKELSAEVKE